MLCRTILSVALIALLILSLGVASTTLGLLQSNLYNGLFCRFFINKTQAEAETPGQLATPSLAPCRLSLASAIIATACLAMLTITETFRAVFQLSVNKYVL